MLFCFHIGPALSLVQFGLVPLKEEDTEPCGIGANSVLFGAFLRQSE